MAKLEGHDLLFLITQQLLKLDLHPDFVSDTEMVLLDEVIARINDLVDFSDDSKAKEKIVVESVNQKPLKKR